MARAKRTDRTNARRRYRAEQAALTVDPDADPTADATAGAKPAGASKGAAPASAGPARPSIMTALRSAFRPVDLRGDLRALPRILTHWGMLVSLAIVVVSTAVFIVSTDALGASLDLSLSNPLEGKLGDTVSSLSFYAVSLFVVPPPAAGAFLVGFTAPRASWLAGLIYGLVAAACYSAILLTPAGNVLMAQMRVRDPSAVIANAWIVAPIGAAFFAAASAWYKRFLNLANPNRGRKPEKPAPKGRGNAKPNSRAASRP